LAHTSPVAHWLANSHVFDVAVHTPPAHVCELEQSPLLAQGHGPAVPPHV
jgi:hypothetical protein